MKREKWGAAASICIIVLLIGVILILAFTGGGIKGKIAAKYNILDPIPGTMADMNYQNGYSGLGYNREATLDARIKQYIDLYGNDSATPQETSLEIAKLFLNINNSSVIAYVDGTPLTRSRLDLARLQQKLNFTGYVSLYNSDEYAQYRQDDMTRLQLKEALASAVRSDADLVYTAIGDVAVLNEAKKYGLEISSEQARDTALQSIQTSFQTDTPEGQQAFNTYLQKLGVSEDTFMDIFTKETQESITRNNLFNTYVQQLPQDVKQDQNRAYAAWNAYVDSLIEKASITLI